MATEVAANVNCDEEITALGRVQQARDNTMENADRPSEFNATGKGTQPHDPSSGGGHGGVPGALNDGQGGVRINNSMDSHGQQSLNMSKDGNVTKTPNCNSTGQADGVLPQAGRPPSFWRPQPLPRWVVGASAMEVAMLRCAQPYCKKG